MDAGEVLGRLEGVGPAAVVEATALALRLHLSPPEVTEMVALQPRIEAALGTLNDQVRETKRLLERCRGLRARAARSAPEGF